MVDVPTPEPPPPELLLLLAPALCEGGADGVGVSATMTKLVTTWPLGFVVTRAEVIVVGVALLLAPLVGLLLLVELAAACEDDSCCAADDCCAGVEDCWGCALEAGAALEGWACCWELAGCAGVVDAAAAGELFAGAAAEAEADA